MFSSSSILFFILILSRLAFSGRFFFQLLGWLDTCCSCWNMLSWYRVNSTRLFVTSSLVILLTIDNDLDIQYGYEIQYNWFSLFQLAAVRVVRCHIDAQLILFHRNILYRIIFISIWTPNWRKPLIISNQLFIDNSKYWFEFNFWIWRSKLSTIQIIQEMFFS